MGLDMYASSARKEQIKQDPDDVAAIHFISPDETDDKDAEELRELDYWRKFNALHGWMEDQYIAKGGTNDFNCIKLQLDETLLAKLEDACIHKQLTPRQGFFFGSQEQVTDEEYDDVLKFISKARAEIAEGRVVFYASWW